MPCGVFAPLEKTGRFLVYMSCSDTGTPASIRQQQRRIVNRDERGTDSDQHDLRDD